MMPNLKYVRVPHLWDHRSHKNPYFRPKNLGFVLRFKKYLFDCRYVGSTKKLALLLDYDGTLAPIAPHPDLAILPPETKKVLERLSNQSDVYIAIVSGRNVENVKKMVRA